MKKCKYCREKFPATKEYFTTNKSYKNGISGICINCHKEYCKQYYYANKDKATERNKQWRDANRDERAEQRKQYRLDNKKKLSECNKQYYNVNREKLIERKKKWSEANKEHQKQYYLNNRTKHSIHIQERKARKRELPATLTPEQWESIKKDFDFKCAYCGEDKPLAQEHFMPLSKGGEYTHNNIVPACKSCNSSKGAKSFFEWYPKFKHYSKQRDNKTLDYLGYKNGIQQLALM